MKTVFKLITVGVLLVSADSALAAIHVVDLNSDNPTPPYTTWATAATNIQDAVDAAVAGDEIVVTNGIYASGGRTIDGATMNRVAVDKPLLLRSENGPQFTVIDGGWSIRCAYLTNGASLDGFTLTNGFAVSGGGGGVYSESTNAFVYNCVVSGNSTHALYSSSSFPSLYGGGAYGGTLNNCILSGNLAFESLESGLNVGFGGGAANATLNNCTLSGNSAPNGGGADSCTLNNCTLTGNDAEYGGGAHGGTLSNCALNGNRADLGGGANSSTLNNCMINSNSVSGDIQANGPGAIQGGFGGGVYACTLNNCTLSGNRALRYLFENDFGGYGSGGGAYSSTLNNCIVYFNSAGYGANYDGSSILNYSSTTPQPTNGVGNITNAPLFVDTNGWANLHLQSNSPCINAGLNAFAPAGPDLDGNPRILGGSVDMGAYEFQSPPQLTISSYGTNVVLQWRNPSESNLFALQSSANLQPAVWIFVSLGSMELAAQSLVTNSISATQQFYRLSPLGSCESNAQCCPGEICVSGRCGTMLSSDPCVF